MTRLWRCSKRTRLREAFSGDDGKHASGRWHTQGKRIAYTSDHAALALLEVLVNGWGLDDARIVCALVSCDFPDDLIHEISADELPEGWEAAQPPAATQEWGNAWLDAQEHAAIRVPNSILPGTNVLINPLHPEANKLEASPDHDEWDPRLIRRATVE